MMWYAWVTMCSYDVIATPFTAVRHDGIRIWEVSVSKLEANRNALDAESICGAKVFVLSGCEVILCFWSVAKVHSPFRAWSLLLQVIPLKLRGLHAGCDSIIFRTLTLKFSFRTLTLKFAPKLGPRLCMISQGVSLWGPVTWSPRPSEPWSWVTACKTCISFIPFKPSQSARLLSSWEQDLRGSSIYLKVICSTVEAEHAMKGSF